MIENLRKNNIQVGMITNGTKIDAKTAKRLADFKVKWVQIPALTAPGRIPTTRSGAWPEGGKKSINAIRHLRRNNVRAHVFCAYPDKLPGCEKGGGPMRGDGFRIFCYRYASLTGRAVKNFDDIKLTASEYSEFYDLVEEAGGGLFRQDYHYCPFPPGKGDLEDLCQDQERGPEYLGIITPQGSCRLDLLCPLLTVMCASRASSISGIIFAFRLGEAGGP